MYGRHFRMKVPLHSFVLQGDICHDLHDFFVGSFASLVAEALFVVFTDRRKEVSEHQEKSLNTAGMSFAITRGRHLS